MGLATESASSTAAITNGISNVWSKAQLSAYRLYQSSTATRYSHPRDRRT